MLVEDVKERRDAKSCKVCVAGASRSASSRIAAGASPVSPKVLKPFWKVNRKGAEKTRSKSKRHFEKSKVSKKTKSQCVILLMRWAATAAASQATVCSILQMLRRSLKLVALTE